MSLSLIRKSLVAVATVATFAVSPIAQAKNSSSSCAFGSDDCFSGIIVQPAKSPEFEDWKIGSFKLTEVSDLVGHFVTHGLTFSEVSLWSHGAEVASDSDLSDGVTFSGISAGKYKVRVSGLTEGPSLKGKDFGVYAFCFDVIPSVPEPESYALMGAGLLAVVYMSRRRKQG